MSLLTTDRLQLSEINEKDSLFILELLNTPSWKKYIGDRNIKTEKEASNYINSVIAPSYKNNGFGFYLVQLKDEYTPIGICGLVKRDTLELVDIGFAFLPDYESKGYGFESASAIMMYAKNKLGFKMIAGITNSDNKQSIALLNKLGFQFQKMILLPNETEEIMLFLNQ